MIETAIARWDR